MQTTHTINPSNIKVVCKVSVNTIVFTPPSNVYNNIINKITSVVSQKGTPMLLRINICNTFITKNSLAVAPMVREMIKNKAPVL